MSRVVVQHIFVRWFVSASGHWVEEKLKKPGAGAQPKVAWFPGHSGRLQVLLFCWQCTAAPEKSEICLGVRFLKYGAGLVVIPRCILAKRSRNNKWWLSEGSSGSARLARWASTSGSRAGKGALQEVPAKKRQRLCLLFLCNSLPYYFKISGAEDLQKSVGMSLGRTNTFADCGMYCM